MTDVTKLKYALAYASIGWHVFPVWNVVDGVCACGREDCNPDGTGRSKPGKHPIGPLVRAGQLDATSSPALIKKWWGQYPDANIGINLHKSGLVVVDVDPRNGGEETLESIEGEHGRFQTGVHQFSGGNGQHFFFNRPPEIGQLPGKLGPGVDLLCNQYVLVSPSNHMSGGVYEWEGSSDPLEGEAPGPLPEWIRALGTDRFASSREAHEEEAKAKRILAEEALLKHEDVTAKRKDEGSMTFKSSVGGFRLTYAIERTWDQSVLDELHSKIKDECWPFTRVKSWKEDRGAMQIIQSEQPELYNLIRSALSTKPKKPAFQLIEPKE